MKKIGNFQTEDQKRLSEQLDRFQDAVDAETSDIRAGFIPQLTRVPFFSNSPVTASLMPGQLAFCDSRLGNVTVTLAPSLDKSPGCLAIVKRTAANNVTVKPSGSNGTVARSVNATTSKVYAAVGMFWLYFDGDDWWG